MVGQRKATIRKPFTQNHKSKRINAPRGGMLSARAGRRKCIYAEVLVLVNTGDFGTRTRHLPRKRSIDINK